MQLTSSECVVVNPGINDQSSYTGINCGEC